MLFRSYEQSGRLVEHKDGLKEGSYHYIVTPIDSEEYTKTEGDFFLDEFSEDPTSIGVELTPVIDEEADDTEVMLLAAADGEDPEDDASDEPVRAGEEGEGEGTETEGGEGLLGEGEDPEAAEVWVVTFYDRDAEFYDAINVVKGEAIGELPATIARQDYRAYWAVGEIVSGAQGTEIRVIGPRINAEFVPEDDTTIVPDYEPITYTVSFYENEDDTEPSVVKTVSASTNYCLNDIPPVPTKTGYLSKWVYDDGSKDFSNTITITEDTKVWAVYDKNIFSVVFIVEGEEYFSDTYYKNDALELPADPTLEGKDFDGWFIGETEIVGGEKVTSDLEITAQFHDKYYVRFVILDDAGEIIEIGRAHV